MIQRLEEFIYSLGISIRSFEQKIGASNGLIRKAISNNTDIQSKWLCAIVENYPRLNANWLLTGKGEMDCSDNCEQFIDRLGELVNTIGLTNLAKALRVSEVDITSLTNGHTFPVRPYDFSNFLMTYPEYNFMWIITGDGPKYKDGASEEAIRFRANYSSFDEQNTVGTAHRANSGIPLIPLEAFCGYGTPAFEDEQVEEYYQVKEFKQADFLMRLKGNSMYPKYSSGDIVACRLVKETLFFQWNKIYAIYTKSQGVMVKRVNQSSKEDCILLVSDNEKYAPFDVPLSDIQAIALVIGVIRVE